MIDRPTVDGGSTAASVGIAQAAAPKKTISISPRDGEVSEKLVLEAEATGFRTRKRAAGNRWDHLAENIVLGGLDWKQTGVHLQPPEGQKTNSG